MIDSVIKTEPVLSVAHESTELLKGEAVLRLLDDEHFLDEWDQLYDSCPWATVFQSRSYVAPWYRFYAKECLPVLVKTEYGGKLTGLFTLAIDNKKGIITGAGTSQAEYQAWLTTDTSDGSFIKKALTEIRKHFPKYNILIKYVPPRVSLNWAKNDLGWSRNCYVKPYPDPLMVINDDQLTAELKKKNRREKMNRLKRMGELKFERITDYDQFAAMIDELALQADFRKGSRYNKVIFQNEPVRKKFFLELFEQGILHVTILKLNDTIIASNVGISGKQQLYLQGMNSHAAAYSKYSPGIIHFLLLGKLLAEEAVDVFVLTPGEDAYKEILATDHTEVYTLEVGNNYCRLKNQLKEGFTNRIKKAGNVVGIHTPERKKLQRDIAVFKEKIRALKKQGYTSLLAYFVSRLKRRNKTKSSWQIPISAIDTDKILPLQKDNLNHLVDFKKGEIIYTRQEFLTDALQRFEEGEHCYTWVENDTLLACAWIANPKFPIDQYGIPGQAVVLSGLYWHPKYKEQLPSFLRAVAVNAYPGNQNTSIYIVTNTNDYRIIKKAIS